MNTEQEIEARMSRLHEILPLLASPCCRGRLQPASEGNSLCCAVCDAVYPVRDGVPILLPPGMQEPGVGTVEPDDPVSRHPYSPAALEIINEQSPLGWVLDLGAGGKHQRWERVVQIDIFRYPMTDVVCTADRLPFRDNAFKAIISQAVFEHLQYPEDAAREVRRVLQPFGTAKIDTAFLQPEHGYPHHFFNATETGLRHWFRDFDIRWSGVESYQHPQWALSWFLGVYLDRIGQAQATVLERATIKELLGALNSVASGHQAHANRELVAALNALPPHTWATLAAGVSITATNPPKEGGAIEAGSRSGSIASGADAVRSRIADRARERQLELTLRDEEERTRVALDRGNYLGEYYPDFDSLQQLGLRTWVQFKIAKLLRHVLPARAWFALRERVRGPSPALSERGGEVEPPFVSVIVSPRHPRALIDAFFSMVHQTYTGWELIIVERPGQMHGVRRAARDFSRLDKRVHVVRAAGDADLAVRAALRDARGEFFVNLHEGSVLAFNAVAELFTLIRQRPSTVMVIGDFERAASEDDMYLRCHTYCPADQSAKARSAFVARRRASFGEPIPSGEDLAHIPSVLARHIGDLDDQGSAH
jgi:uncharacterized protein YbaR (Trm112 family)